jgi:hypothetical protein
MLVASVFLSISFAFSQDDATKKIIQDIEKSEKLIGSRTTEEKKLQYGMYELLRDAEMADTSAGIRKRYRECLSMDHTLKPDSKDRVNVEIGVKSAAEVKSVVELIESLDGIIIEAGKDIGFVICKIHPKKLRKLASSTSVVRITPNIEGHTQSVISAGDVQLKADSARAQFMVSGFGIKVGVISDGVDNLNDVRNNFELPAVTVLNAGSGNEGTAVLEIIHDLASDADLYFYSGMASYLSGAQGIKSLKASGCKIIVDDLGYYSEPYFTDEDDTLGAAIRDFLNNGGTFISAAGNENRSIYNDPRGYSIYSGQTSVGVGNLLVFPNGWTFMDCWVNANTTQFIFFQWATSWKHPTSNYDLYVYDDSGIKIDSSQIEQTQNGSNPPMEMVRMMNNTSSTQHYKIVIKFVAGISSSIDFKINSVYTSGKLENSYTDNKHVYGHRGYPGVMGVAAYNAELYDQMAALSSGGPLTMFSTVSNQWTTQLTPVVTATAGVTTWVGTNPPGNLYWPGGYPLFYGTSAAAPHVAAIAALYFQEFPTRTRDNFIADIENSAVPIEGKAGNGSWDSRAGYGKANALACLKLAESGGAPPPPPPGTAYIAITNVQDTVIQTGQSIVTTTVTYARQRKWLSAASPCVWWIEIWIDNARVTQVEPPQSDPGNTFSFSYSFGYGNHNIKIVQNETDPSFCLGWSTTASTIRTINIIYAPVLVTLDQKTQDSTRVGTLGLWNGSSFNPRFTPPMSFTFPCFSAQVVHGDTNLYQSQKYNYWSIIRVPMPDVTNHNSFNIDRNTTTLLSNFAPTKKATLQTQLIDGGNPGGSVDFKDPWLIDSVDQSHGGAKMNRGMTNAVFRRVNYDASKPNLDTSTAYKGVFLNENPNFLPNKPIYSVQAPLTQTNINGFTGYFKGWTKSGATLADSTNDTTAVVFNSANATVTALYKAHLGSSVSTATSGGGRKIVKYFQEFDSYNIETYYAVYPSAGSIWFTRRNTYDQPNWTPETKIADGKNPSIAITGSGELRVVWEKEPVSGQRVVYYSRSTNEGTSWDTPITIATTTQTYDATPVPLTTEYMRALWRGSNGLYASIYITSPPQWIQSGLSGLSSIAQSPSVSTIKQDIDTSFGLVCQDTNKIKYCRIFYEPSYAMVTDLKEISAPGTTGNVNPTIALYTRWGGERRCGMGKHKYS